MPDTDKLIATVILFITATILAGHLLGPAGVVVMAGCMGISLLLASENQR